MMLRMSIALFWSALCLFFYKQRDSPTLPCLLFRDLAACFWVCGHLSGCLDFSSPNVTEATAFCVVTSKQEACLSKSETMFQKDVCSCILRRDWLLWAKTSFPVLPIRGEYRELLCIGEWGNSSFPILTDPIAAQERGHGNRDSRGHRRHYRTREERTGSCNRSNWLEGGPWVDNKSLFYVQGSCLASLCLG